MNCDIIALCVFARSIGYDDKKLCFICANSWSTNWGNKGLFYLPYNYVTDNELAGDFCIANVKV